MSPLDIIELPGQPGKFGRRILVEAWQAAGSPPVSNNGAGRLYGVQKYFWDGWAERLPGFNPADNPDDESQRLAHVRFVALDIDPTPERVRRLAAAGLIRPYSYEPWHWELPNVRRYAIVRELPATPQPTPLNREDHMIRIQSPGRGIGLIAPGYYRHLATDEEVVQSEPLITKHLNGNDRQFDLWVSMALTGRAAQDGDGAVDLTKLAQQIVAGLPPGSTTLTAEQIAKAVNDDASRRMTG